MYRAILLPLALSAGAVPALAQAQDPIAQIRANFGRIDANGDGVLSRAEYRDVQVARWRQIDRNGDGFLAEDDFPASALDRARTQLAEVADLDGNGDGRISQAEFLDGTLPLFLQIDQNADGVLTRAEIDLRLS